MSKKVKVCVFYANGTPNNEGELNYHKFEEVACYKDYQKIVGGYFSEVPGNETSKNHKIGCYCNEDGIALKLPENQLAQLCLKKLGFAVVNLYLSPPILGNVVIFNIDEDADINEDSDTELSLNETQIQLINKTVEECKSEWDSKKSRKIEGENITKEDSENSTDSGPTHGDNNNDDDMDNDDPDYTPEDGDDDDYFDEDFMKDENEVDKTVEYIEEDSKT